MTNYTVKVTISNFNDEKGMFVDASEKCIKADKNYVDAVMNRTVDYNDFFNFSEMTSDEIEKILGEDKGSRATFAFIKIYKGRSKYAIAERNVSIETACRKWADKENA